jgi:STE24 endopeptidase
MKCKQIKAFWKRIKIGFWRRIAICVAMILSVAIFNAFDYPLIRLTAIIGALVSGELLVYCYVPFYLDQIGFLFRNKASERPLPDEIADLAKKMGMNITKMKLIPKICNAGVRGNQLFVGEELLKKLDLSQLKAVVAHEFGHIKGKHAIVQFLYILPIMVYLWLNWHNLPPAMMELGLFAYMIIALIPIYWEFEKRADLAAVRYVGKEPIKSALLTLVEKDKLDELSETHPSVRKRLKWIDEA